MVIPISASKLKKLNAQLFSQSNEKYNKFIKMTNITEIIDSIAFDLASIIEADTNLTDIIFDNPEDPRFSLDFWFEVIDESKKKINKITRHVNSLILNDQLNDPKYHDDVTKFYKLVRSYDSLWKFIEPPKQFSALHRLYEYYINQIVKPYRLSLISESICVIKDKTPIVDDNICDILSYLNDEKFITKHQVDTIVYG